MFDLLPFDELLGILTLGYKDVFRPNIDLLEDGKFKEVYFVEWVFKWKVNF